MQSGLTSADRKLLAGAGVLVVLLVAGSLAFAPSTGEQDSGVPSTYSSTSSGARAAYLLLEDLGYGERRWEESPSGLESLARGTLLIMAEPTDQPTHQEMESLWRFVRDGGQLLFCGAELPSFFPEAELSERKRSPEWKESTPRFPSGISRGIRNVEMQAETYWGEMDSRQLGLFGRDDSTTVVDWQIGEGRLLWWAGAAPLTNAGIGRADNLKLFLNSVAASAAPGGHVTVYWDEYFHGQRTGLWGYFQKTPLTWGLIQFCFGRAGGAVHLQPAQRSSGSGAGVLASFSTGICRDHGRALRTRGSGIGGGRRTVPAFSV